MSGSRLASSDTGMNDTWHLFSPEGEAALASTLALRPLLAFDYDGMLAPIETHPDDAHMPLAIARRLDRLAALLPVALITGRSVADVRERLSFPPRFVIGNHGAEGHDGTVDWLGATFDTLRMRLKASRADLLAAGVTVEDKGHSLALHYRLAGTSVARSKQSRTLSMAWDRKSGSTAASGS